MRSFSEFKDILQHKLANYKPFPNSAPADELLEELARGEIARGVLTMPSQHGKSSTTDLFAADMIGMNPLIRIIAATYSQKLARKHSRMIKEMIRSPEFEDFFGWAPVFGKDAEDDWEIDWPGRSQGSTFLARSVESPALGESADLLIIDDPLSGGNSAYSPTKQERAWEAVMNVLFQRLTPTGMILMIATLWTESDPSIKAMAAWKASATPAVYVNLAALNDDGKSSFRQDIVTDERAHFEPYDVLWPEYRNLKFIEAKRAEMMPEDFETQYMGNPIATGGLATDECWGTFENLEDVQYAAIFVDTGVERGTENDPTMSLCMGYGSKGFYILDVVSGKWKIPEMEEAILQQMARVAQRLGCGVEPGSYIYKVPAVFIEKATLGTPLHDALAPLLPLYACQLMTTEQLPKEIRARAQAHHIQAGRVYLPKYADWVRELKRQWLAFPRAAHDEFIDLISYGLRHRQNVHTVWSHHFIAEGKQVGDYREDFGDNAVQQMLEAVRANPELANGNLELEKMALEQVPDFYISPATERALRRYDR